MWWDWYFIRLVIVSQVSGEFIERVRSSRLCNRCLISLLLVNYPGRGFVCVYMWWVYGDYNPTGYHLLNTLLDELPKCISALLCIWYSRMHANMIQLSMCVNVQFYYMGFYYMFCIPGIPGITEAAENDSGWVYVLSPAWQIWNQLLCGPDLAKPVFSYWRPHTKASYTGHQFYTGVLLLLLQVM